MHELSKQFRFEAAHTLDRAVEAELSRRIHGHSYRARVTIRGVPEPRSQMVLDYALFDRALDQVRDGLDHRFLDHVPGLGAATMEGLCSWIWRGLAPDLPGLARITLYRDSTGEECSYDGS